MYDAVLVPTDGSESAGPAVERAVDLGRTFDAVVHALAVVEDRVEVAGLAAGEREADRDRARRTAHEATLYAAEVAAGAGVEAVREVREGPVHRAVAEYRRDAGIDVVVLGSRGLTDPGPGSLGSKARRVVGLAEVPVLVVPPNAGLDLSGTRYGAYDEVVVPVDGSDDADYAADQALPIAERYGAAIHGLYVVDATTADREQLPGSVVGLLKEGGRRAVDAVAEAAGDRAVPASTAVLRGVPEDAIVRYADGCGADLLAMGTRGLGAAADPFLGSTTARVLGRSTVPVLVV